MQTMDRIEGKNGQCLPWELQLDPTTRRKVGVFKRIVWSLLSRSLRSHKLAWRTPPHLLHQVPHSPVHSPRIHCTYIPSTDLWTAARQCVITQGKHSKRSKHGKRSKHSTRSKHGKRSKRSTRSRQRDQGRPWGTCRTTRRVAVRTMFPSRCRRPRPWCAPQRLCPTHSPRCAACSRPVLLLCLVDTAHPEKLHAYRA